MSATPVFWLWNIFGQGGREPDAQPFVEPALEAPAGDRAVLLVFPSLDGTGYVTEQRQLPSRNQMETDLLALMNALCEPLKPRAHPVGRFSAMGCCRSPSRVF